MVSIALVSLGDVDGIEAGISEICRTPRGRGGEFAQESS